MPPNILPPSIAKKRGIKAALLRRLPRSWHNTPRVKELAIPQLKEPHVTPYDVVIEAETSTNLNEKLLKPQITTIPIQHQTAIVNVSLQFQVSISKLDIGAFRAVIYGIRYRTTKQPTDDITTDPDKSNESQQTKLHTEIEIATEKRNFPPSRRNTNPYAILYGLLYPPPDEFAANVLPRFSDLRPYQRAGIDFLVSHKNALLADDMGLGKTAQCAIAATVLLRSERIRRVLIICPRALVKQWEQEANQWARLLVRPVEGDAYGRKRIWNDYLGAIIATPNIVLNDIGTVTKNFFDLVVCDDVSMLKNPGKTTSAIRKIPRERSWCLSGTPLENKPEDFTNVMEYVHQGLFTAYERQCAPSRDAIQNRVKPFFLRRRKVDCLKELPDKLKFDPTQLEMKGQQAKAYQQAEAKQWSELQKLGVKVTKIHIFSLINVLLQLCSFHEQSGESAKAEEVGDQLDILFDSDPDVKVIVFTRWLNTLEYLEQEWSRYNPQVYHGSLSTTARSTVLDRFKKNGRLLLMSTKAGSRGLNLQEASYVYHFDRTWNPMDEMQAEDRCWRMGQSRKVFVYRYIQIGTIEERIHEVLTRKHNQFLQYVDSMAEDSDIIAQSQWTIDELVDLMRPPSPV